MLDIWHAACDGAAHDRTLALDDLREDLLEGMTGRARPAVSEAEIAPCCCPELCVRDHENE